MILGDEFDNDLELEETSDQLIKIEIEEAMQVGEKALVNIGIKLPQKTKHRIKKGKNMRTRTTNEQKEFAELTKVINRKRNRDNHKI